jgi:phenylalanine-4-hydroxylase
MDANTSYRPDKKGSKPYMASLIFSITDKIGGLSECINIIKEDNLNMTRIESRPSKTSSWDYDFFVDFADEDENKLNEKLNKVVEDLKNLGVGILATDQARLVRSASDLQNSSVQISRSPETVAWFPRKISDLDLFAGKTLEFGSELSSDHPGFTDEKYRHRRKEIVEIAKKYKHGEEIPRIEYTKEEIQTWGVVYRELMKLYPTHACRQVNYIFPLLEANCGYSPNNIPQLQDVSNFLHDTTGWRLRPVQGLLSSRDFLNGLAFRVFHSTQYIRHHSRPLYTPEPDVCHELLGHVPLFADPDFAEFSQEIGLASLGASDDDIKKLATCYWFTIEFGLCRENGQIKAYGAGILSSFGELKYSLGGDEQKPEYLDFDPFEAANREYPITTYQPRYYVAESFSSAKEKLMRFASSLKRPFGLRYNAYTESIDILDSTNKIAKYAKDIQSEMKNLQHALEAIQK